MHFLLELVIKLVYSLQKGLKILLLIGDQTRPDIFARKIFLKKLYNDVYEIHERLSSTGKTLLKLNIDEAKIIMQKAINKGYKSVAIVLMHAWKYLNMKEY